MRIIVIFFCFVLFVFLFVFRGEGGKMNAIQYAAKQLYSSLACTVSEFSEATSAFFSLS